jgi:hypothetical protein
VITALNADRPYDRFLQEQIAGDELTGYWEARKREKKKLPAEVVEGIIATGFLRCASDTSRPDFVNIKNAPGYYYQTLDDTVKITVSATMGLTVQCARCHSHKFDPIPQREYYQIQAIFMGAYRPGQWVPQVQRRLLEATEEEEARATKQNASIDKTIAQLRKSSQNLQAELARKLFEARLAALPAAIREDVRVAINAPAAKRTVVQQYLAGKFAAELRPTGAALLQALTRQFPDYARRSAKLTQDIQSEQKKRIILPEVRALYDLPGEPSTRLLRRGDYLNPGAEVKPGVLTVLTSARPFRWSPPKKEARTSGRRLAFARWLTQPDHPLTARVIVNRLWLHHFGEGIVSTPENFGRSGSAPSHPELLDFLATELVRSGWSLKHLHRLIMQSAAYQQGSSIREKEHDLARKIDPDNRLLWRQRMRRLEAEAVRDAILHISGSLNTRMSGPPVPMVRRADGEVVAPVSAEGDRRSIYLQVRRSQPLTILQVFDQPVIETNCTRRATSTVSSQALTLLNSDFVTAQSELLARRIENEADPVAVAVRLTFGRPTTSRQSKALTDFMNKQTARHGGGAAGRSKALVDLCHVLLCANEMIYID